MSLNLNTELALLNTTNNPGTITLPVASSIPGRVINLKDSFGTFTTNIVTLNTTGSDTFEDGTTTKVLKESRGIIQLVASNSKWYILTGTQHNTITTSTLYSLNISTQIISSASASVSTFNLIDNVNSTFSIYQKSTLMYYNNLIFAGTRVAPGTVLNTSHFTPLQLRNLYFWFDGSDTTTTITSGTNILQWNDKSANNFNAIGSSGTYPTLNTGFLNSKNTITFNGTNQFLQITSSCDLERSDYCFFAIMNIKSEGITNIRTLLSKNFPANPYWYFAAFFNSSTVSPQINYTFTDPSFYGNSAFNGLILGWNIICVSIIHGVSSTIYANGTTSLTTVIPNVNQISSSAPVFIGKQASGGTSYYNSDIAEMLCYKTTLLTSDRQQIEGYLAWKWGLQATLPVTHPYKNAPPQ